MTATCSQCPASAEAGTDLCLAHLMEAAERTGHVGDPDSFAAQLITSLAELAPLFDAGEGMKADLERRGWSPAVAEALAHQWTSHMLSNIFSN